MAYTTVSTAAERLVSQLEKMPGLRPAFCRPRAWLASRWIRLESELGEPEGAPCITDRVGSTGLADRDALIDHLRRLTVGGDEYEVERRRRVEQPQLLVETPIAVVNQDFEELPTFVSKPAPSLLNSTGRNRPSKASWLSP